MPTLLQLGPPDESPIKLCDDCVLPRRVEAQPPPAPAAARELVAKALACPVGFPTLDRAIVPGDRVAVALGESLPDLLGVAAGIVGALTEAGVEPAHVSLVTTDEPDAELLRSGLGHELPIGTCIVRHDPADENELCFAGVTREDDVSLLINRVLFDADLAIPVSCARSNDDREHRGAYGGLYPAFADAACQKEYRRTVQRRRRWWNSRTEEAGWLIGAPFVVQVVPGRHGSLAAVVAGDPRDVTTRSDEAASRQWRCAADRNAALVIATIAGEPERQTWNDLARALIAAEQVAAPDGAVAVCSEIGLPIGRSLARLRNEGDLDAVAVRIAKDSHVDTWAAQQVVQAMQRGPLFLRSRLPQGLVEELGMAPIGSGAELERLASRFASVALLEDAPHLDFAGGNGA